MTALQRLALQDLYASIRLCSASHAWQFLAEETQQQLLKLLPLIQAELDKPEEEAPSS